MYTNPHNIILTVKKLLDDNALIINKVVRKYEPKKTLTIWEGMRATLPASAFPSLEIEPVSAANSWATVRAQRPRYSFNCTLTVMNDNENFGVEYIVSIVTVLVEIMTDPQNLNLRVIDENRWEPQGGLVATYIIDSLVEDITYNANKQGTIRTAEFSWFALIHEPFPESHWKAGDPSQPSVVRPQILLNS